MLGGRISDSGRKLEPVQPYWSGEPGRRAQERPPTWVASSPLRELLVSKRYTEVKTNCSHKKQLL